MDITEEYYEIGTQIRKLDTKNLNILYCNIRTIKAGNSFDVLLETVDGFGEIDIICVV